MDKAKARGMILRALVHLDEPSVSELLQLDEILGADDADDPLA